MTIYEAIERLKSEAEEHRKQEALENQCDLFWNARKCRICAEEKEKIAEWLEELKTYQQLDLEIPQHFTKEQSDWIKKYCIDKNKEFYKQGVDDLKNELLEFCAGYNCTYDSQIIYVAEQLKV